MNLDGCDNDFVETTPKDELPNLLELLLTEYEDGTSHRPVVRPIYIYIYT